MLNIQNATPIIKETHLKPDGILSTNTANNMPVTAKQIDVIAIISLKICFLSKKLTPSKLLFIVNLL